MTEYIISPSAIKDLEQIIDYFATRNVDASERFLSAFQKQCRYLTQFPYIGRSYKSIRPYLHGLPMDGYIIFIELEQTA